MPLTFSDLITPAGTAQAASSFTTTSMAPNANRLIAALVLGLASSGTSNVPTLVGGGVSTWTPHSGASITVGSRRLTLLRALTGTPTSGEVVIDFAGQTQSACVWQFIEINGALLTGSNGADAIAQVVTDGFTSGALLTLELASWASAANVGLASFFAAAAGVTYTMTAATGFTQLAQHSSSGRTLTAFYGRDGADLSLGATASTGSGVKLALGVEIVAAAEGPPPPTGGSGGGAVWFG